MIFFNQGMLLLGQTIFLFVLIVLNLSHVSVTYRSSIDGRILYRSTRLSVDYRAIYGSTVSRLSTDYRPIVGRQSTDISVDIAADISAEATDSIHDPYDLHPQNP